MTSFTKPEVQNARSQVTCTENVVKYGHLMFEICERTDRQTDKQTDVQTLIAILRNPTGGKVKRLPIYKALSRVIR